MNLEAIACGTPVLTFQTGGSPESAGMIDSMIIKSNTLEETLEKIEKLDFNGIDKDVYASLRDGFNENRCYEKYIELYQQ